MVQIESSMGAIAAAAIAAVDGVDGLFVGPAAKAAGKTDGILAPVEADARRYIAMGANFVSVGSDLGVFRAVTQALRDRYTG